MNIKVIRSDKALASRWLTQGIVDVYCRAFSGYPWFEECDPREAETKLREEMSLTGCRLICVQGDGRVMAFAWGYALSFASSRARDAIERKLDAPGVSNLVSSPLFYLSEFAVDPELQKQGIGWRMLTDLRTTLRRDEMLLRTLQGGPMVKLVTKAGGQTLMPTTSGNRVMMSIPPLRAPWPPCR